MMKWISDRGPALIAGGACYAFGLVVYFGALPFLEYCNSPILGLTADKAPGGVTGADLIANLLTISALTISGCFAYICLPSDRIEVRISTYVEHCFINKLVSKGEFEEYCSVMPADRLTHSCKSLRGLLAPRNGLGGWHRVTESDLSTTFGSNDWKMLSRFVDQHTDTKWVTALSAMLSVAMGLGAADLGIRYLGLVTALFHPFEFAMVCVLASLNIGTAIISVRLAFGGTSVEKRARERINTCVDEVREHITSWQATKRDDGLSMLEEEAKAVSRQKPAAGPQKTQVKPARQRSGPRSNG